MTRLSYGGGNIPTQTFLNLEKEKQDRIVECAFDEFSIRDFDNAKLSNIVKSAKIPRGSLYQYFKDKTDLYLYLIDLIGKKKLAYINGPMANPMDLPFVELFKKMYLAGIDFAIENPKMVRLTTHLLHKKGPIYEDIFAKNIDIALNLYKTLIDRDKELGRIRKDIDTDVLAKLVVDMTMNITVDETSDNLEYDYNKMYERVTQILKIFEKGVITGE